ncbi:RNA chaperone Hfq [candidate division BRC1 bacterium HGW-BRC1-1]|nr:MAG: RNA chaperone Hfq [candidate division BRC1 bacterium HGW-BRC1-1]
MKSGMNLQDSFLNQVRREATEVQILLTNGTLLRGMVKGFDNFTLILNTRNGRQNLVYKHAIAQIVSARAMRNDDDTPKDQDAEQSVSEKSEVAVTEPPSSPSPEKQQPPPVAAVKAKAAPAKETFNSLDLSKIKLAQAEPTEVPSK